MLFISSFKASFRKFLSTSTQELIKIIYNQKLEKKLESTRMKTYYGQDTAMEDKNRRVNNEG